MKKYFLEQKSPQWFEWRSKGLGGSDIYTVLSGSPLEKKAFMSQVLNSRQQKFPDHIKAAIQRGIDVEPIARALAEKALATNLQVVCVEAEFDPRFRASLDGLSRNGKILIEIKSLTVKTHDKVWATFQKTGLYADAIPARYIAQIQYQLMVSEAEIAYYVGYNPESATPFYMIPVTHNYQYQASLREAALAFFDKLDKAKGVPNVVAISGFARSGKDTIAEYLMKNHGYLRYSIADNLKRELEENEGMPKILSDEEKTVWRPRMVEFSREVKEAEGEDWWIRMLIEQLSRESWDERDRIVVPDVRYVNEVFELKQFAAKNGLTFALFGVIRNDIAGSDEETLSVPPVMKLADKVFVNTKTIADLEEQVEMELSLYG